jgi:hypothetical protein
MLVRRGQYCSYRESQSFVGGITVAEGLPFGGGVGAVSPEETELEKIENQFCSRCDERLTLYMRKMISRRMMVPATADSTTTHRGTVSDLISSGVLTTVFTSWDTNWLSSSDIKWGTLCTRATIIDENSIALSSFI